MTSPTLHLFTFKRGMLSRVAHDLRLSVQRFEVTAEAGRVTAHFELDSLRVDGAMKDGSLQASALDAADREKIERTLRAEVLEVTRHPTARLQGILEPGDGPPRLRGELELHGKTASIEARIEVQDSSLGARLDLVPSHWGIEPYRALGGALRLEDRVRIEITLPDPPRPPWQSATGRWRVD